YFVYMVTSLRRTERMEGVIQKRRSRSIDKLLVKNRRFHMNNKMIDELKLAITPAVTLCQAGSSVWQFILSKTENDRVDYLKIFLTGFKSAEDIAEKPSECFFGVEWKNKQEEAELTDLENRIVSNLIGSSMEESAFYAALCTKLSDDTLL